MEIFPAIDLRNGRVVRLLQGDYDRMTVYSDAPVDVAQGFKAKGARNIHLVDLDGAKDGKLVNFEAIKAIIKNTEMFVEVGGGIRDEKRIKQYLNIGVNRVILGTAAVKEPDFLLEMVKKYKEKIAVGVDAKDGFVAIDGWKKLTDKSGFEFCEYLRDIDVKTVIYTDISRDGALKGANIEIYKRLQHLEGLNVIASGGISFEDEILQLKDITYGAILGKSLYTGALNLERVLALSE